MMKPTPERLRDLFDYDPATGELRWKPRPLSMFTAVRSKSAEELWKLWTSKCAGKVAGTIDDSGYVNINAMGFFIRGHSIVWALHHGAWPQFEIDHINGVRTDNRIENLRDVPRTQNARNMKRSIKNKSGQTGVFWSRTANKWCAQIRSDGKARHLGNFRRFEDAVAVRKAAERLNGFHPNHGAR